MVRILGILWLIGSFSSCQSKTEKVEPAEVGMIDPDQRARPKDGLGEVTDVTLDGKGDIIAPAEQGDASHSAAQTESARGQTDARSLNPQPDANQTMETSPPATRDAHKTLKKFGSGSQVRYIKARDLNIRTQPNRFSKIVGMLNGGDKVYVTVIGGWAKLEEGQWIRSRWLTKTPPTEFIDADIEQGMKDTDSSGSVTESQNQRATQKGKPVANKSKKRSKDAKNKAK